jgi:hypothetical protein
MATNANLTDILITQAQSPTTAADLPATVAADPAANVDAWVQTLPEAYRNDPNIKSHTGLEGVLAEYTTLKASGGKFEPPPADATFEAHKEYYTKLGVPETADKYNFAPPEGIPAELALQPEVVTEMQALAHQLKLPAKAVEAMAAAMYARAQTATQMLKATSDQELATRSEVLEKRWGNEKDVRVEFTKKGYGQFADAETAKSLEEAGITTHPAFLHLMSEVGKAMALPTTPGASSSSGSGVQQTMVSTPEQARAKIQEYQLNPEFQKALRDAKHPNHKMVNGQLDQLYQQAYS